MKHWVFDLDGTLVDSFTPYFNVLTEVCRAHGKDFVASDRQVALHAPTEVFLTERIGAENVATGMKVLRQRNIQDATTIQVFPHLKESLEHLRRQGKTISVLTNRDRESAEELLKQTGLQTFISILVGGTCVSRPKPEVEGLLKIAEFHRAQKSELVMIGDHDMDVEVGKKGGAHSIRASWHGHWEISPCKDADQQFFSSSQFYDWVKKQ